MSDDDASGVGGELEAQADSANSSNTAGDR
jgi:hypothetical protein